MRKYYKNDNGFIDARGSDDVCWVDVAMPAVADESYLVEDEGIPPVLLEYLQDKDERPRVEREGEWFMTIIRIPIRVHDEAMPFDTVPLGIISRNDGRVFTVCYHDNEVTADFAEHTRRKSIIYDNVADFSLRILYSAAFWYLGYLRTVAQDVLGTEKKLSKSVQNNEIINLMKIQKSLVFFSTSVKGDCLVLERIGKIYAGSINNELYEDVEIELRQADSTIGIYSNILEGTMDAYASIINNNVNGIMKRMTGLSIMLMVPTFVASLYGMNVDILLGGKYAFWIIILIAVALTAVAFVLLKRIRWI